MRFVDKLKDRWGVGPWGVIAILIAFSLAGPTVLRLRAPIMNFVLPDDSPRWVWWTVYLVLVIPIYQVVLLFYGTLLGQFRFFWDKEKKITRWLLRPFSTRTTAGARRATRAGSD